MTTDRVFFNDTIQIEITSFLDDYYKGPKPKLFGITRVLATEFRLPPEEAKRRWLAYSNSKVQRTRRSSKR